MGREHCWTQILRPRHDPFDTGLLAHHLHMLPQKNWWSVPARIIAIKEAFVHRWCSSCKSMSDLATETPESRGTQLAYRFQSREWTCYYENRVRKLYTLYNCALSKSLDYKLRCLWRDPGQEVWCWRKCKGLESPWSAAPPFALQIYTGNTGLQTQRSYTYIALPPKNSGWRSTVIGSPTQDYLSCLALHTSYCNEYARWFKYHCCSYRWHCGSSAATSFEFAYSQKFYKAGYLDHPRKAVKLTRGHSWNRLLCHSNSCSWYESRWKLPFSTLPVFHVA
jgi:hypothetical protein